MPELALGLFDLPGFGHLLEPPQRPRKARPNPSWRAGGNGGKEADGQPPVSRLAALLLIALRQREVMVKVTGINTEAGALRAHLNYLQRRAEGAIEDEQGMLFDPSPDSVDRILKGWGVAVGEGHANTRREALATTDAQVTRPRKAIALHLVLSMPQGTAADGVLQAARGFAAEELVNHQHVLVLHTDKNHPHVHLVVNNIGNDLRRLPRSREDLQRWREVFARELRAQGIEAAATPRKSRGMVQKAEPGALWHAKHRLAEARRAGRAPDAPVRNFRNQIEQAANELRGAAPTTMSPAESRARQNRRDLETALSDAVTTLDRQGDVGVKVARAVTALVQQLPPAETVRDQLKREIANRQRGAESPPVPDNIPPPPERGRGRSR